MSSEIYIKVKKVCESFLNVQIEEDMDLINYGMNSISFIKLIVKIEDELGIKFSNEDLDFKKFTNISKIISHIEENLK